MTPGALVSIVEDDESVRKATENLIRSLGWSVLSFESAAAYLSSGAVYRTGCLISDVTMSEMTGIEMHAHLISKGCAPGTTQSGAGHAQPALSPLARPTPGRTGQFQEEAQLRAASRGDRGSPGRGREARRDAARERRSRLHIEIAALEHGIREKTEEQERTIADLESYIRS